MRKWVLLILFLTIKLASAQTVFGKWKTYDIFNKKKEESIVEIYKVADKLYIKILEILPEEHRNDLCTKCSGKQKDQPILGMVILEGAQLEKGVWQGAKILNAKNGNYYGCHISLAENDLLKVRGFVGYPLFGKTVYWTRVKVKRFH